MNNNIFNDIFWDCCKSLESENPKQLALKLQKLDTPYDRFSILNQIVGLKIAKTKLPSWYAHKILYPKKISMEQCSSEWTARYKVSLVEKGKSMIDLTAGFGIDCGYLSKKYNKAIYNEQNSELAQLAKYNYKILGYDNINVINKDALEVLDQQESQSLIYLDPARRDKVGKKTVSIEDCEPNIIEIQDALFNKTEQILIKLSPMLDIESAISVLKYIYSIHIVSVKNECKELLFLLNSKKKCTPNIVCVNIDSEKQTSIFEFAKKDEQNSKIKLNSVLKKYIYEPNASILKAGAFKILTEKFDIEKLHPNTHLYTNDNCISNFPGRIFELVEQVSYNSKNIKRLNQIIEKANISTRNFPLSPENLKAKLKIKDGGDIYIFGTTLSSNQKELLICKKTNSSIIND